MWTSAFLQATSQESHVSALTFGWSTQAYVSSVRTTIERDYTYIDELDFIVSRAVWTNSNGDSLDWIGIDSNGYTWGTAALKVINLLWSGQEPKILVRLFLLLKLPCLFRKVPKLLHPIPTYFLLDALLVLKNSLVKMRNLKIANFMACLSNFMIICMIMN